MTCMSFPLLAVGNSDIRLSTHQHGTCVARCCSRNGTHQLSPYPGAAFYTAERHQAWKRTPENPAMLRRRRNDGRCVLTSASPPPGWCVDWNSLTLLALNCAQGWVELSAPTHVLAPVGDFVVRGRQTQTCTWYLVFRTWYLVRI